MGFTSNKLKVISNKFDLSFISEDSTNEFGLNLFFTNSEAHVLCDSGLTYITYYLLLITYYLIRFAGNPVFAREVVFRANIGKPGTFEAIAQIVGDIVTVVGFVEHTIEVFHHRL